MLDKRTTYDWPDDGAHGKYELIDALEASALAEGNEIAEDDEIGGVDASTTDALDRTTGKQSDVGLGEAADDGANGEEQDGGEEKSTASEDVGEGGNEWLEDGAGEEVRGCNPKGCGCVCVKVFCNSLQEEGQIEQASSRSKEGD